MDATDKAIINRIQSDFPRTERPYAAIGQEFGLDEAQVIERVSRLKESGIIRRIGGNFVPDKLGFVSTLCAARVPKDKVEMFTEAVNQYPGVTHNYLRENDYNIWFTFISPSMDEIKANLSEISAKTGVEDIINLPATNVYKIRAQFEL
ncbi:AsnC family transcriptional regulator [Desulfatibacillum alkenivorans]|nr:AsnC family transcriptional regulator [Desulfatibacillum alkenivorans]